MNDYLAARYGNPCNVCGYDWSIDVDAAAEIISTMADRYDAVLAGCTGRERHRELIWDAGSYVAHVADNNRIWAERVAAAALGDPAPVVGYDEEELAAARSYGQLSLAGALWALRRSVDDWHAAVALAGADGAITHPEQGPLSLADCTRILAHESHHHLVDIERIVARSVSTPPH